MQYHIAQNGQPAGTFSEEDVRSKLLLNEFSPADLCWTEGMADWQPLSVRFAPAAAPASTNASSDAGSALNPYAPPQALIGSHSGSVAASGGRTGPAWEQRATLGIPKAILETSKAVLLQPAHAFATMKRDGGIGVPFGFFMIMATIGIIVTQVYGTIFQGAMLSLMGGVAAGGGGDAVQPLPASAMVGGPVAAGIVGIVALLIIVPVWHFISSGLIHLTLTLLKGANHPFETTFRVASYASGAGMVFYVLPICGSIIGWVWSIVVICIGLGKAHDTSTEKGVGATLIPLAVCCVLVAGVYAALFGTLVAAAAKSSGN